MYSKQYFYYCVQQKIHQAFEDQDPELSDIIFEIDGNKLYAHKFFLSIISDTFKAMLSNRWNSKNEPIELKGYKFNDFKEFLTFIYSGECNITDENIYAVLDLAEFYHINHLKELCEEYLLKMRINIKRNFAKVKRSASIFNRFRSASISSFIASAPLPLSLREAEAGAEAEAGVHWSSFEKLYISPFYMEETFYVYEMSNKYSLYGMKKRIRAIIAENFSRLVKSDGFLNVDMSVIEEIVALKSVKYEEIFEAVYEWAEIQATKKQEESMDEHFNKNDAIKIIISPFLPYIRFKTMQLSFLNTYVVKKGFLFSHDELSDILNNANPEVRVTVTNSNGDTMHGYLPSKTYPVTINVVKSLRNCKSDNRLREGVIYWRTTRCKAPSVPSRLKYNYKAHWYLIYFPNGDIGVKNCCTIIEASDYLLAKMDSDVDFEFTVKCKIEVE